MGLADLTTLADRPRMAVPKYSKETPSQKADAERKADEKALGSWRRVIWKRDRGTCRCCFRHVLNVLEIRPERGECHHIVPRAEKSLRYDRRNGALVCLHCHEQIERGRILVRQKPSARFSFNGKRYIDSDKSIQFVPSKEASS